MWETLAQNLFQPKLWLGAATVFIVPYSVAKLFARIRS
jgi:hypothetical protein